MPVLYSVNRFLVGKLVGEVVEEGPSRGFFGHCEIQRSPIDSSTRRRTPAAAAGPGGAGEPAGAGPGDGSPLAAAGRGMAASCSRLACVCPQSALKSAVSCQTRKISGFF